MNKKFLIILIFLIFWGCKKNTRSQNIVWERDPNLKLIAKPSPPFKAYSDAVLAPSGKIYYLAAYEINNPRWIKQALKVIKENGEGDKILLKGEFQCLDISPYYDKLIIGTNDGKLILVDTLGKVLAEYKTYFYYHGNLHFISVVKFDCSGSFVYYTGAAGSIYRMKLADSTEEFVQAECWSFDIICPSNEIFPPKMLTPGGRVSIFLDSIFVTTYLLLPVLMDPIPNGEENQYILIGLPKAIDKTFRLIEVKPYEKSTFYCVNFSPNGKKIIFSAYDARWEANPNNWWDLAEYLELWIYEDFDKLGEKYFKNKSKGEG